MRKFKKMSKQLTALAVATMLASTPMVAYAHSENLPGGGTNRLIQKNNC